MLEPLFSPGSVVVIGVSPSPRNLARNIVGNLMELGYGGEMFLVGRSGGCLFGHRIRPDLDDLPEGIDLAVIMVPARMVPDVMDQCGRKGIRHAIVQTGGFKELGSEGEDLQARLIEVARTHGIRFVGPNCLGVISPGTGLGAVFMPIKRFWLHGGVSVVAQSGGVGVTYLYHLASENIGLSRFLSVGNKLSLDETDYLQALIEDGETGIIVFYLEDIGRGRAFFDAVRGTDKPVLVQKANRTALGKGIAFSHTAAMTQDDDIVSAALKQAGAIRVRTLSDMISHIKAFQLPPVRGRNVAVIARSGGHAVIAADAAADAGFELPDFPAEFLESVRGSFVSDVIRRGNPLDLGDLYDFDSYARIMEAAAALPGIDAVVMAHEYFAVLEAEQSRKLVPKAREVATRYDKPVCLVLYTDEREIAHLKREHHYPFFTTIEETFTALRASRERGERVAGRRDDGACPVGVEGAAEHIRTLRSKGRTEVLGEGLDVLARAGLNVPASFLIRWPGDLPPVVAFPVAAKVSSRRLPHKSDSGGVVLGIGDRNELTRAVAGLCARFGPFGEGEGVMIQRMAPAGVEMIVGGLRDPSFGPVVTAGMGGVLVELMKDSAMRLAPVTLVQAREMIDELKTAAVLKGFRGKPPADVEALARVVWTVSHLLAAAPEIAEIDINPVIVHPEGLGVTIVDTRMSLS